MEREASAGCAWLKHESKSGPHSSPSHRKLELGRKRRVSPRNSGEGTGRERTFEVEDGLAPKPKTVVVERSPIRNVGLDRLVDPLEQPPSHRLVVSRGQHAERHLENKMKSKELTEMINGAGMQCTNSSYSIALTSNSLSGVCSPKTFSAALPAYFSQSGLGTASMSSERSFAPVRSECVGEMDLNVGSCVWSASSERSARRRFPDEMRARRMGMWGGREKDSRAATEVIILAICDIHDTTRLGTLEGSGRAQDRGKGGERRLRRGHRREGGDIDSGSAQ